MIINLIDLELTFPEEMEFKLSGKLVIEELYSLPITNWYKFGLYLGIQEYKLQNIKKMDKTQLLEMLFPHDSDDLQLSNGKHSGDQISLSVNGQSDGKENDSADEIELPLLQQYLMFKDFAVVDEEKIEDFISTLTNQEKKSADFLLLSSKVYEICKCKQFITLLSTSKQKTFMQLVQQRWLKPVQLVLSLVRVGHKKIADNICKNKGV